jgi:ceramide glucosyltransferase
VGETFHWLMGAWWLAAVAVYLVTTVLALIYARRRTPPPAEHLLPPVSVLVPVRGIDAELADCLRGFLTQAYPAFEVLFSVADAKDPAIPMIRRVAAEHPGVPSRLVIGDVAATPNPKVNNLIRSYRMADHDLVLMCDCNVALHPGSLRQMVGRFAPGVGLVSAIPIGVRATNFVGELECALQNGFGARLLSSAALLGTSFAIGKILFLRRSDLDRAGGLEVMTAPPGTFCEDCAIAGAIQSISRRVVSAGTVDHPVGSRRFKDLWSRHVRWEWCRRSAVLPLFIVEPLLGAAGASLAGALCLGGLGGLPAALASAGTLLGWLAVEALHLRLQGWPLSWRSPAAWAAREALLPFLWLRAATTATVVWRDVRFEVGLSKDLPR